MSIADKKVPVQIDNLFLQTNFPCDDAYGRWQLKKFGEEYFPGVTHAGTVYTSDDSIGTDEVFDAKRILPIGIGGGRFCEHRPGADRIPGECAATLVGKHIGTYDNHHIRPILDEVLYCDTNPGIPVTSLPELIKMSHRHFQKSDELVCKVVDMIFDALYRVRAFSLLPNKSEEKVSDSFKKILASTHRYSNQKIVLYMHQVFSKSVKNTGFALELDHILRVFMRCNEPQKAEEFLRFAVDTMYSTQTRFHEALEVVDNECPVFNVCAKLGPVEYPLTVRFVNNRHDNPFIQKAARYRKTDIIAVRNSKDQVQIYGNNQIRDLNFRPLVAMLRWLELPNDKKNDVDWSSLEKGGKINNLDIWYFMEKGPFILNGSESHPYVPASRITTDVIMDVLRNAFHPLMVNKWKQKKGITVPALTETPVRRFEGTPLGDLKWGNTASVRA